MASGRDVSVFFKAVDYVTAPIRDMNTRVQGFVSGVSGLMKGLTAALGGLALGKLFKEATDAAAEAQSANTRLAQAVENVGGSYEKIAPAAKRQFDQLQATTRFSASESTEAMTRLTTLTGNHDRALALLNVTADVAAYKQIGMADAAEIVGKVSNGNTKVLKEFGVEVKEGGNAIELLSQRLKGQAENEGKDWNGFLARGKNALGDILENIGAAIISNDALGGAFEGVIQWLASMAEWVETNEQAIGDFVTGVATLGGWVVDLAGWIKDGLVGALNYLAAMWETNRYEAGKWELKTKAAAGAVLQSLGEMLVGAKAVLKKLGFDVGEGIAETMAKSGQRMVSQAAADLTVLDQTHKDKLAQIYRVVSDHEDDKTAALKTGSGRRVSLQRQTDDLAKESVKELARAQEVTLKWAMQQFDAHYERLQVKDKATVDTVITHWKDYRVKAVEPLLDLEKELADAGKQRVEKIRDLSSQVTGVARGLLDAAQAVGGLDAGLASALTSAINLGESIGKVASGDILGGITQGIGAIANIGKSLFGKSEQEKKVEAALKANTSKLEEHRRKIGDLIAIQSSGSQLAGVQGALEAFAAKTGGGKKLGKGWADIIGRELLGRGVSFSDLDEVAKTLNIDIRPGGHINPQAVLQLLEGLKLIEPGFSNDYSGQRERIGQGVGIGAIGDELGEAVKLLSDPKLGAPAIAGALQGLDPSNPESRAAAVTALRDVFGNIGNLKFADFGGLNEGEFRDAIAWLVSLLQAAPAEGDAGPRADTPTTGGTGTVPSLAVDRPATSVAAAPVLVTFGDAREWMALDMMTKSLEAIGTSVQALAVVAPSPSEADVMTARALANAERERSEAGGSGALIGTVETLIVQAAPGDDVRELAAKIIEQTRRDWADDLRYYRRAAGSGAL